MKLQGDLFTVKTRQVENETLFAALELNAMNRIFEGHFPGQPVLPGVCQMQIIKELTENVLGVKTRLAKADSMKFLNVINPIVNNIIDVELTYRPLEAGKIYVTATMTAKDVVCFKFKGLFMIRI
jgi:3-hydroxyacyl-[acyl-carrier-protein] dehydratase